MHVAVFSRCPETEHGSPDIGGSWAQEAKIVPSNPCMCQFGQSCHVTTQNLLKNPCDIIELATLFLAIVVIRGQQVRHYLYLFFLSGSHFCVTSEPFCIPICRKVHGKAFTKSSFPFL